MASPKEILKKAQAGRYAVGAFNFSTAEVLKAIVAAAKELGAPIIVATSEGEGKFVGWREAAALVNSWKTETELPVILNLDHGKSLEIIKEAIEAGYDAIHFDGSELSYEENLKQTEAVVKYVRETEKKIGREIIVEGELGYLRGGSSVHKEALEIKPEDLTKPEQAKEFAEKTGVDSLAIVIGNAHGVFSAGQERLNLERLAQIKEAVGERVFLVLHGGSGLPEEDIKKAIGLGIVKVNINTELRVAYKEGLAEELEEKPEETTPYKMLEQSFEDVKKVVGGKIKLFGSENRV
ncbi:MAG: class II fructose-bisphosphate aldolase [Candidatus Portnoybacteria bacterium]|jgi:fructose-bisphosphate aldolase class II|nr:class II fructose-bisphosphate aldolase [Candidatus Portnoybacteria bacterium]